MKPTGLADAATRSSRPRRHGGSRAKQRDGSASWLMAAEPKPRAQAHGPRDREREPSESRRATRLSGRLDPCRPAAGLAARGTVEGARSPDTCADVRSRRLPAAGKCAASVNKDHFVRHTSYEAGSARIWAAGKCAEARSTRIRAAGKCAASVDKSYFSRHTSHEAGSTRIRAAGKCAAFVDRSYSSWHTSREVRSECIRAAGKCD